MSVVQWRERRGGLGAVRVRCSCGNSLCSVFGVLVNLQGMKKSIRISTYELIPHLSCISSMEIFVFVNRISWIASTVFALYRMLGPFSRFRCSCTESET